MLSNFWIVCSYWFSDTFQEEKEKQEGKNTPRRRNLNCTGGKTQRAKDSPGGGVVRNPPANAGDAGLVPGLGRFHTPVGQLHVCAQPLSLRPSVPELRLRGLRDASPETHVGERQLHGQRGRGDGELVRHSQRVAAAAHHSATEASAAGT